ncbi:TPA: hypothetical protein SHT55_000010 [Pseudomonas aeruginosa]|nr:hypothetical protein [Pseudomonas aeruginosa]
MDKLSYWKLCSSLTPVEAAALIVGVPPERISASGYVYDARTYYLEGSNNHTPAEQATEFRAALTSLAAALRNGKLTGDQAPIAPGQFHLSSTRIDTESIRIWLSSHGITSGFFFPDRNTETPSYLDQSHPHYSPKLAAAVRAWEAVSSQPERLLGKTPKQALQKWLRENAAQYGLSKDGNTSNEQGIEDISKVANWSQAGGVSKTPGK